MSGDYGKSKMHDCVFCTYGKTEWLLENSSFFVILDKYPVNPGHLLIISKRHVLDLFDLTHGEFGELCLLLKECRDKLFGESDRKPEGFNVGANCGEAAGQTVFHFHLHVIPRFKGDVADPRGGVRNIKTAYVAYL